MIADAQNSLFLMALVMTEVSWRFYLTLKMAENTHVAAIVTVRVTKIAKLTKQCHLKHLRKEIYKYPSVYSFMEIILDHQCQLN